MEIRQILQNKKRFIDLLLLGDEQESMIDRYLERGDMFVLYDGDSVRAACVVTNEGQGICELKNIATRPECQRQGYGKRLINHVSEFYRDTCRTLLAGTGETPSTLRFYQSCGFSYSHRIPDFFTDNYDHTIIEEGKPLTDMIYLKKELPPSRLHRFPASAGSIGLPEKFTDPFHYTPHPLCSMAAEETLRYLESRKEWHEELRQGKMFGVLAVQTESGQTGYLAAFSGTLAGSNNHPWFVPPVYDLLQPEGFFRKEEKEISGINAEIERIQAGAACQTARRDVEKEQVLAKQAIEEATTRMKAAKEARDARRPTATIQEQEELIRESQYQKAEFRRLKKYWQERIHASQLLADKWDRQVEQLKAERKRRSAALQQQLFGQFRMLNGKGEAKDLCELFKDTPQGTPPAGAGECAAPKLLQYAYLHRLRPVAMAEFWWGDSPKAEIRRHGHFYPACQSKCAPILKHMLQGIDVEGSPSADEAPRNAEPEIVYEDDWLVVVNKPAGMLSVPGKTELPSVYDYLRRRYPDATGPLLVHRLDMATSGLLLAAKEKDVHRHLQAQFADRTIQKRYTALVEGTVVPDRGTVALPICPNPEERPRQMVHDQYGKPSVTRYEVIERGQERTLVSFYPLTGRTHQIRLHAAHPLGLNAPVVGDGLYGHTGKRLYLHAEYLAFTHPVTGERLHIERKADFRPEEDTDTPDNN